MDLIARAVYDLAALDALRAGVLLGLKVDLFSNDIIPNRDTDPADLDVATYAGYAQATATWTAASISDDGHPEIVSNQMIFRPTGSSGSTVAYGLYCTTDPGGIVAFMARFDNAPIPTASAADDLRITLRVRIVNGGIVVTVS